MSNTYRRILTKIGLLSGVLSQIYIKDLRPAIPMARKNGEFGNVIPRKFCFYTAPCNGVINNGAQIGASGFSQPRMQKQTQNQCAHDLCVPCSVLRAFYLHAQTAAAAVTYLRHLTNCSYFDYEKNTKTRKLSLMSG